MQWELATRSTPLPIEPAKIGKAGKTVSFAIRHSLFAIRHLLCTTQKYFRAAMLTVDNPFACQS